MHRFESHLTIMFYTSLLYYSQLKIKRINPFKVSELLWKTLVQEIEKKTIFYYEKEYKLTVKMTDFH